MTEHAMPPTNMPPPAEPRRSGRGLAEDTERARQTPTVLGGPWRFAFFGGIILVVVLGLALSYFGRGAL